MKKIFLLLLGLVVASIANSAQAGYVVDHTDTDLSDIPDQWVTAAKSDLHIVYNHTSHGSQLITGIRALRDYTSFGSKYDWVDNSAGNVNALSLGDRDIPGEPDLSQGDKDTNGDGIADWAEDTYAFLDSENLNNNSVNVVLWSWCNIHPHDIDRYIRSMEWLIAQFSTGGSTYTDAEMPVPASPHARTATHPVQFVFMTAHANGGGEGDTSDVPNTQIRQHVASYDRILFDFSDMENYDPDDNYYLDKLLDDALFYDSDDNGSRDANWASEYLISHSGSELYQLTKGDGQGYSGAGQCAHSNGPNNDARLNCVLKGRGAWHLFARLAGWDGGTGPDTTPPVLAEVEPIAPDTHATNDTTPDYTFSSTEAGTISYGGDCASVTTSAVAGNNTITFNELPEGTYDNCTLTVTDAAGNESDPLEITFFVIDTTPVVITEVTPVPTPANDTTPEYTFDSDGGGTINYFGSCSSSSTTFAQVGNITIYFDELPEGTYDNCSFTVTDEADNVSEPLNINTFTIDLTAPVITLNGANPMTVIQNGTYTEPGATCTDNVDGDCEATIGGDTVDTNTLGTYVVTYDAQDIAGNNATQQTRTVNVVSANAPTLVEVTPVPTPTNEVTPSYVFSSDEEGTISYGGDCSSTITNAVVGDNTISFEGLTEGTYENCTITVTDVDNHASAPLNVTPFTIDLTAPVITLNGVNPMTVIQNETYTEPGATCTDNVDTTCNVTIGGDAVNTSTLGTYIVTYDAQDTAGNNATQQTRTVNVVDQSDTTPPTLTEVTPVSTPTNDTTPDYTFSSDEAGTIGYGGDCSSTTTNAVAGNNTITFNELSEGTYDSCTIRVTDAAGNTSDQLAISNFIIDLTAPVITLQGNSPLTLVQGETYIDPGATCTDNIDGNCSVTVGGDTVNTNSPGTYKVVYTAQDAAGNTATKNRTVLVTAFEPQKIAKPIYRFWSDTQKAHFYTMSKSEKEYIEKTYPPSVWRYEGIAYNALDSELGTTHPVFRFWSDTQKAHFYTISKAERDYIMQTYPANVWRYEGVAFYAATEQIAQSQPLFRFWSDTQKAHFYTMSAAERDYIIETYPENVWKYEGVAWYGW